MSTSKKSPENRYVNDLRRYGFGQTQFLGLRGIIVPVGLSILFLAVVAIYTGSAYTGLGEETLLIAIAAVIGGYMALNIGANDVANNMGPAVGGKVITVFWAVVIAAAWVITVPASAALAATIYAVLQIF